MPTYSKHWEEGYTSFPNNFGNDIDSPAHFRILFKLFTFHYCDEKHFSLTYVSKISKTSVNTASRALKELKEKGYLKLVKKYNKESHSPNLFQLAFKFGMSRFQVNDSSPDLELSKASEEKRKDIAVVNASSINSGIIPIANLGIDPIANLGSKELTIKENNKRGEKKSSLVDKIPYIVEKTICNKEKEESPPLDKIAIETENHSPTNKSNDSIEQATVAQSPLCNKDKEESTPDKIAIEIENHWNGKSNLKKANLNFGEIYKLGIQYDLFTKSDLWLKDIKKGIDNYSQVMLLGKNGWYTNNVTILQYFGLDGHKEQARRFSSKDFDIEYYQRKKASGNHHNYSPEELKRLLGGLTFKE